MPAGPGPPGAIGEAESFQAVGTGKREFAVVDGDAAEDP